MIQQLDMFIEPQSYYQSPRWQQLRTERLILDNHRCRMCNAPAQAVHHRRYPKVMGDEVVEDLTSLCHRCHHNHHKPPGAEQVRMDLHARLKDGKLHTCPVCDQKCKIYKYKIDSGMSYSLLWMVKQTQGGWIDMPKEATRTVLRCRKHGRMAHWGVVEAKPSEADTTKKDSGLWRPTSTGIDFAMRRITLPKYVWLYHNHVVQTSEEQTDIIEALGDNFDYSELMQATPMPTP